MYSIVSLLFLILGFVEMFVAPDFDLPFKCFIVGAVYGIASGLIFIGRGLRRYEVPIKNKDDV